MNAVADDVREQLLDIAAQYEKLAVICESQARFYSGDSSFG